MDRLVKTDVKEVTINFTRGQKSTAAFDLTNLMHTMSVVVSLSTTNPASISFPNPFSILPPLSSSSFTLHLSQPSDHPPLSSPPDTILVRSCMLPTGKAHSDDLRRLFSKPGPHVFKDATIPVSFIGPHVVQFLLSPLINNNLEVGFLLSKATTGCDQSELTILLRSAARVANPYFVSALINAGADVNNRDSDGKSVISVAVQSGDIDSVRILIESGSEIDDSVDTLLHDAAAMDRVDIMEVLCLGLNNIDVNSVDSNGQTVLHIAAIRGQVKSLEFLLCMGGDPDIVDYNGWSPLHCAAVEGHREAAELLLNSMSFAKSAVTKESQTAFALAVEKCHWHLYDSLHLGDVLHRSSRTNDVVAMKSCIAQGANVNGKDQNGWTPLHRAAFRGGIESVKLLLSNGAKVDVVDDSGHTPLQLAVEAGHVQVATCLIAHGTKVEAKSNVYKGLDFEMVPFNLNCFKNHLSRHSFLSRERKGLTSFVSFMSSGDKRIKRIS